MEAGCSRPERDDPGLKKSIERSDAWETTIGAAMRTLTEGDLGMGVNRAGLMGDVVPCGIMYDAPCREDVVRIKRPRPGGDLSSREHRPAPPRESPQEGMKAQEAPGKGILGTARSGACAAFNGDRLDLEVQAGGTASTSRRLTTWRRSNLPGASSAGCADGTRHTARSSPSTGAALLDQGWTGFTRPGLRAPVQQEERVFSR